MQVYEAIAAQIRALGVEAAFGLMSDDTLDLITACEALGIRFYGSRHETSAVVMAEGYASAAKKLGVAIIGRGPGATNALSAAVHSSRTGSPVLIVFGEAPVGASPSGVGPDLKSLDAAGVFTAAGLQTFSATSTAGAQGTFRDAAAAALRGRAVTLHLPTDVLRSPVEQEPLVEPAVGTALQEPVRPEALDAAVSLLSTSRRPLILAGAGAHHAGARTALEELAERIGAILCTTLKGKDLFAGNPYHVGIAGSFSTSAGRRLVDQADCVLAVGAGLNMFTMSFGSFLPAAPLIQVDSVRTNIGRYWHADVAVVGDARTVTEQLLERLPPRPEADKPFHTAETRELLANFQPADDFEPADTSSTVDPRSLVVELDRLLPENRTVVTDAGQYFGFVWPYLSTAGPERVKLTSDFACIGLGLGTAIGVAIGRSGRSGETTVLFIGDGALLMTLGELETVVREDIPLVIVVMNDAAYGAERHQLAMRGFPIGSAMFPDADFADVAAAFGFETATVRSLDDLEQLTDQLAAPTLPLLIDCKITGAVAAPFIAELH